MKREIKQYFEMNENENIVFQNLWNATKQCLEGKFISVNTYIKKEK